MNIVPDLAVPAKCTPTAETAALPIAEGPYLVPDDVINTPIKRESSTMLPFTTLTRCRHETIQAMGKEMKGYFVGPMPVEDFLQEFLPTCQIPDYDPSSLTSAVGAFSDMLSVRNEEHAYIPFINAIKPFAPQLSFVDTHIFNIKPDICVYPDGCAPSSHNCNVSTTEIIVKFKWSYSHDAFCNPSGVDSIVSKMNRGMDTLGQITSYAAAQLGTQFRTHTFSLLIVHDHARIIRWDREGAIVTSTIDYNNEPYLADFFHRYAQASPEMCGVDTSVTLAGDEEADLARSQLNIPSTTRMFKLDIPSVEGPGSLTLIIPQPLTRSYSPVGCWTRACPAFDLLNKKVIMFKDSWQVSLPNVLSEGETYKLLHSHNVSNITNCIAYHDIPPSIAQQSTQTAKFGCTKWATPHLPLTPHILHRLALNIVGEKLTDFESSRQLILAVRDALIAHKEAFELAKGYLIDWDLAKLINIQGPQQTTRTGTWQFMSAYLIEHKYAIHSVKDDLESSFYVVLWMALMYKETYMDIICWTSLATQVFETNPGSSSKADWLIRRSNLLNIMFVDCKPLDGLIHALAEFFSHRYTQITDHQQMIFDKFRLAYEKAMREVPITQDLLIAAHGIMTDSPVYKKEMDMKVLDSHDTVIDIFNKQLDLSGWPVKDATVLQKLKHEEKYKLGLFTKSQSLLGSGVEVTLSGKRCRLDNADADDGDGDCSSLTGLGGALTSLP
ncbi:uncharacterized protein F5891DRAFT_1195511 [Suillus fuscotomentosus]|uniref:Fungal-type protein kinase domain-containing protein n=1 Tax=Suillus fuscotomentosus TaxID=1912939 RepID=A0AAD4DUQ6_9AGAM|nr:uncharacterized protein F5891DRAFT_1195511 [Suillus fuscotomentosus]KAG1894227.1 hypothetical protein F5891DRAFT_1195511 [Suillus fuscotomentosus]